jgi:hypothetical protein
MEEESDGRKVTQFTNIKFRTPQDDVLGSELGILLRLLNLDPSEIVRIAGAVSPEEIAIRRIPWDIAVLQSKIDQSSHSSHAELKSLRKDLRAAQNQMKTAREPDWLQGKSKLHPLFQSEAEVAHLQSLLRTMTSAWVDTGVEHDESENPKARTIQKINVSGWRLKSDPSKTRDAEPAEGLYELLTCGNWKLHLAIDIGNAEDGYAPPLRFKMETPFVFDDGNGVLREALEIMARLLISEERFHISQCRRCGRYFRRRRVSATKRFVYCGARCQNSVTAAQTLAERRDNERKEKLKAAAGAIAKYMGLSDRQKQKIADWRTYVADRIPGGTVSWVTRQVNQGMIQPPEVSGDREGVQ